MSLDTSPAFPGAALPEPADSVPRRAWLRPALALVALVGVALGAGLGVEDAAASRAVLIAGACLVLWLAEVTPPFVPTLLLLAATPALLGPLGADYRLPEVLAWCADPVLALFLGGFTLQVAASRHGLDAEVARQVVKLARGSQRLLLLLVIGGVAFLSMWMSNIAAAAMMLASLRPVLRDTPADSPLRRALLLGVALGANLGGMATPVGSGPNALAISAVGGGQVTFVRWMALALPLTGMMLAAGYALLVAGYGVRGAFPRSEASPRALSRSALRVLAVSAACILAWLTEPLHGLPAPLVALAATAILFGTGLLRREDLGRIDWSTLLLIAGGIALGRLVEHAGLVSSALANLDAGGWPLTARLGALVALAAVLSAVMSNTGTAALLIPLSLQFAPSASAPILVAIGCSFGMPFAISTPPNAMVAGEGGVTSSDLLRVGLPLMVLGCLLVSLTGPSVLRLFGLP
ncbi:SLC13 family permease [Myxococcaceae bacterium GXIMD 01537]